METLRQDLRFAVRTLVRNPAYSVVVLLTLALGIGANSAIFSVVNTVLLRPLPYAHPDRIAMIWNRWVDFERTWISEPEIFDYREGTPSAEAIAPFATTRVNLTGDLGPERVSAAQVSAEIWKVLGVHPQLGRVFTSREDRPGNDDVVVLSYSLWQRRFGGEPGIIGQRILVDGIPRTVVGVMPRSFELPLDYGEQDASEIWEPLALDPANPDGRGSHYLYAVARLRPGATADRLTSELWTVTRRLTDEGDYPPQMRFEAFAVPVTEQVFGPVKPALLVLLGAVGFVLLIACANVANLSLARSETRSREAAVRVALGAGRGRLARALLTESVLIAVAGAAVGLVLAIVGVKALSTLEPGVVPRLGQTGVDIRVLGFTGALTILTAVLFGLPTAIRAARTDPQGTLREEGRGSTAGRRRNRFRGSLVVAEVGLAVMLVIGAGLTIRSFSELVHVDPGFRSDYALTFSLFLPQADYPETDRVVAFYDALVHELRGLPGVTAAGAARSLPLATTIGNWTIDIEGKQPPEGQRFKGDWQIVTPGYFEAMGIPVLSGRAFTDADRADATSVCIINAAMARQYWPDQDPIGKRLRVGDDSTSWSTIVGVVGDVRHNGIGQAPKAKWYMPHAQFAKVVQFTPRAMNLVIRTTGDPLRLSGPARATVRGLDPNLPISGLRSMDDVVSRAVAQPRFTTALLSLFAAIAATLAAVGVYGVMAYSVSQRTHEVGIRMAVGADRGDVFRLILARAAGLAGAGVLLGVAAALLVTRLLSSLLYGIGARDPLTFLCVPAILMLVALGAGYFPARRATRADPMTALRYE